MGDVPSAPEAKGDAKKDALALDEPKLKGIYSIERTTYLGLGATRKKNIHKAFWAVWEHDADNVKMQVLNSRLVPSGPKRLVPIKELESSYKLEPEYFIDSAQPKPLGPDTEGQKPAAESDSSPPVPAASAAPKEEDSRGGTGDARAGELPPRGSKAALKLDADYLRRKRHIRVAAALDEKGRELERTTRIAFDVGLSHLKHGNTRRALKIFEELISAKGDFNTPHKHMFNEFGIGLRKNKLPKLALKTYERAMELSPYDENLHHNIARIYYELGDMKKALEYLEKSLQINPELVESEKFWEFIMKRHRRQARKRFEF